MNEPISAPRWARDLVHDIRFHDGRDGMSDPNAAFDDIIPRRDVTVCSREGSNMSVADRAALASRLAPRLRPGFTLVEVGVSDIHNYELSATFLFVELMRTCGGRYVGLDLGDRSHVRGPSATFLQLDSSDPATPGRVRDTLAGAPIDFLFIDGNHSIHSVLHDWELCRLVAPDGLTGFHDTAYHPGPHLFVRALDKARWHVEANVIEDPDDWGVGFAWRRS